MNGSRTNKVSRYGSGTVDWYYWATTLELIQKEAVCKEYKKHLEQVIEYHSVEKYRSVVQKNRATSPDSRQDVSISIKTPVFNSVKSEKLESISTALVEKAAEMNSLANEVSRLI